MVKGQGIAENRVWAQTCRYVIARAKPVAISCLCLGQSEMIIVRDVLHNVFHAAVQDVAKPVDGVGFYILIMPKSVQLGAVYIIMSIEGVLRNAPFFHRLPQTVILNHPAFTSSAVFLTFLYYRCRIAFRIVCA